MPPRKRSSRSRKRSTSSSNRRRVGPSRRSQRRLWLLLAVAVAIAFGGFAGSQDFFSGESSPGAADSEQSEKPDSGGGNGSEIDVDRAREQLSELTVAEWASMSGYSRDEFPHWRSVDGCDARQTVLARDGEDVETADNGCRVVSGSWFSPFDGVTLTDPGDIDIDHMVPLANAWRTGAADWDKDRRAGFANDLDTPQLIAVSASSNRTKGDQDPSQWKPEPDYWCQYAHDWIAVKHSWELWVTEAEQRELESMLSGCD